jgi:hypothetical protein
VIALFCHLFFFFGALLGWQESAKKKKKMTAPKFRALLTLEACVLSARLLSAMIGDAPVYWTMQGEGLMRLEADNWDLLVAYRDALCSLTRHVLVAQSASISVPSLGMHREGECPLELLKFACRIG